MFRRLAPARRPIDFAEFEEPIRAELFSAERLEQHAQSLAVAQAVTQDRADERTLVPRVRENGRVLYEAHRLIGNAARQRLAITPAAEWLLDNFHVVEDQLRGIREHLPAGYYKRLPKLADGHLRGYPRVYGVAWAIVAHTDSRFDPDWLIRFVRAYQRVQPLTIGELWAVPITLRIVLVENLRRLAVRIVGSQMARQGADKFVDELLPDAGARPADLIERALRSLGSATLWPAFAVQLVQRLRYQAAGTTALLEWLHREPATQGASTDEIVQAQHAGQAAANLTVRNLITSMRAIAAFDWRSFFEDVSLVDATLRQHPGYVAMDFTTRDRYRHAIEDLARGSGYAEIDVAAAVIAKTQSIAKTETIPSDVRSSRAAASSVGLGPADPEASGAQTGRAVAPDPRLQDPGFYLIAAGRATLERELGYRSSLRERCIRACRAHATAVYLDAILLLTLAVAALPVFASIALSATWADLFLLSLLSVLGLLPASDMAIALTHRVVTKVFGPRPLPRLALQDGIPASLRTFVVMPTLLGSRGEIAEQIERLEMHSLSNRDGDVYFALLTDWRDANTETVAGDAELLAAAAAGIEALNARYGPADEMRGDRGGNSDRAGSDVTASDRTSGAQTGSARFFHLHRTRLWNPGERKWMGWERKRGKLHEFNRLLRGATDTSFLPSNRAAPTLPSAVRYVVTVDADTKLPFGAVKRLVGTAAHALNRPLWDRAARRVVHGYGVLQPRVTPAFPTRAEATIFQRVFSGPAGLDPYASAVSDVYQDLFGEGSYTGKGLYDVDVFENALAGRVPENTVLSHDLFESIFARCGLVSDVEFFDDFPSNAEVAASRQHRWARGDWQLVPWIFGRAGRGISLINRWKMFDNLRRTLSPPACVLLLLASWSAPGAPLGVWTAFVLTAIAFPGLLSLVDALVPRRAQRDISPVSHLRALAADFSHAGAHAFISVVTLAQQAWLMLDAITRTLARLFVTRRRMLVWVTAAQAKSASNLSLSGALWPPRIENVVFTLGAALALLRSPAALPYAAPFLVLWWCSPILLRFISLPPRGDAAEPLSATQVALLRATARRIWLFFTTFVTAEDHALPPDNFQEQPEPVVAHRSSPTNFGLYLLSCVGARDFGWIGLTDLADRIEATADTLLQLARYRGHFFNWYETRELRALDPKYVSTVDSGNLAGHLLAVAQGCDEFIRRPLLTQSALDGLGDALHLARAAVREVPDDRRTLIVNRSQVYGVLGDIEQLLGTSPQRFSGWVRRWETLSLQAALLFDVATTFAGERGDDAAREVLLWVTEFQTNVASHARDVEPLLRLLAARRGAATDLSAASLSAGGLGATVLSASLSDINLSATDHKQNTAPTLLHEVLDQHLAANATLDGVVLHLPAILEDLRAGDAPAAMAAAVAQWGATCAHQAARLDQLAERARRLAAEMDFAFLFDANRQLFHIGYRVDEGAPDDSYYDLLASEARLASFVAIAKGDVPSTHWFHLGRAATTVHRRPILLSWSGSMFEYLMPSLVLDTPRGTLLDQTCRLAVARQIEYGNKNRIPWGISESAYNQRDRALTYQYSGFGVPGLGLKRGLGQDLVVAPYATAMAAMVDAAAAARNLARLHAEGGVGRYGPYEAIDYTPARLAEGQTAAVVCAYMAHHQGISLVAFANTLRDGIMRRRFHNDPLGRAAELLLQERPPREVTDRRPRLEHLPATPLRETARPATRQFDTAHTPIPATHLLSNGRYAVMLTAAGSGYSQQGKRFVTRWREDVTIDAWGAYLFLRDVGSSRLWSATYQPTTVEPDEYNVVFAEDRARFTRRDGALTTVLEVIVSSEDDAEVRRLSITNHGLRAREIEITSYAEVVLTEPAADIAHPAFSNLFVQTEYVPEVRGLLATRRARSAEEPALWAAHVVTRDRAGGDGLEYETDRARFLGRGRTVRAPAAVLDGHPLSNTVGPVLDPVLSLRTRVRLPPGATAHTVFSTMVAASREAIIDLADKYHDASTFERISMLAWTQAQVQLHHLGIEADDALLYQELANRILFSDPAARPSSDVLKRNVLSTAGLWPHGISGDHPIVLLSIDAIEDHRIVAQLLRAHEYWQMKGLAVDLVILNDKASSYVQDLQALLEDMARTSRATIGWDAQGPLGRIFVLRADLLGRDERALLHTVARAVLIGGHGGLAEQVLHLQRLEATAQPPARRDVVRAGVDAPAPQLPPLEFFNGLGGFADAGREYVIVQGPHQHTPMPWINVVANPDFGFQVSETGAGYTWSANSRENQLTAWSNDPVSDPPGEAIYIRDEESEALWTPTAAPIRIEHATYVARHGQGYSRFQVDYAGIACDWLQFVSWDDPVKISRLTLTNHSSRPRRLSITAYVEWVLGTVRAKSAPTIVTERDVHTGAVFAFNPLHDEFGARLAFADLGGLQTRFTCDRTEFLGRDGNLEEPAALTADVALGNRAGAGLDPCCAQQTTLALKPGQRVSVVFLLGQAADRETARNLLLRYRAFDVDTVLARVKQDWDRILGTVQVETPDRSMDLMLNRWLQYQTIVCRLWARAAFYQAGGAYGFRDQLQDTMALTLALPDAVRAHLLRAAARQFVEGDVQHWWHPPTGRGVRTHCSDDLVWLPYAAAHYVAVTGDAAVLEEPVPFLEGPLLEPAQHDAYFTPALSPQVGTLFEHCARALDRSLSVGAHGLPLMGNGDWNDGMNRVGHQGKGESVWLAWFLHATLLQFATLAESRGASAHAARWQAHAARLQGAAENEAWDGAWYRRAYFDDGTPLGSAGNAECRIDSLAQSWSVLSGAADPARARRAMEAVDAYLVRPGDDLVLLFTPPFDKTDKDPGYIKGYLPGVRENGGQYTHAAAWCVMARAALGDGERAAELFATLNPVNRAASRAGVHAYKVEPYVVAADIYAEPPHVRRGGWTWYTGAAGWLYRAALENMLGLTKRGDVLHVAPCIPPHWSGFRIRYRHGATPYEIRVANPRGVTHGIARGVARIDLDGVQLENPEQGIALRDDGQAHHVRVVLG
jgi:cyclic beta-1,2-glucan synthetase